MATPKWWENLAYFKADEEVDGERSFPEPEKMDREFMFKLDRARGCAGIPFKVTSSYREGDERSHGEGLAVDIRAHGSWERLKIVEALLFVGIRRIGVYDKHIHGDVDPDLPEGIWSGTSS